MDTASTSERGSRKSDAEIARLEALAFSGLLDGRLPDGIDTVVQTTSQLMKAPMVALTAITEDQQVVISEVDMEFKVSKRSAAFCDHTIHHVEGMVVTDATSDERFASSPLVTGPPFLRSYAGVPVRIGGHALGALCVMSQTPGEFGDEDLQTLHRLARLVDLSLELGWRREIATPPLVVEVEELATQLAAGYDVDILIGSLSQPAMVFDRASMQIINVNDAAVRRYGWSRDAFCDMTVLDIKPADTLVAATSIREDLARSGKPYWDGRETQHLDHEGKSFPVALRLADFDLSGRPCRLAIMTDISAHQALSDAVERAANFDPLTTFGNRRFLMSQLEAICDSGQEAAVLMIDLDHFRSVNDVVGHGGGDELIVAVAARIAFDLPAGSIPTRYGGDTFVVVVPDVDGNEGLAIAERIRRRLEDVFLLADVEFRLTASAGVTCTEPDMGPIELLGRVDDALDDAKRRGRNQTTLADPTTRAKHRRRSRLGQELKAAIDDDQLELWYQPIVDLRSGDVVEVDRVEALVRWRHPTRGLVPPGDFLGLLEVNGLMPELNRTVLDHACRAAAEFRSQGREVKINVNCSAKQFNCALVDEIDRAVDAHDVRHSDLRLEITESAFSQQSTEIVAVVDALSERAIPLVIDDFGAGHSSLGRLLDLPVQGLKLDRGFIAAMSQPRGRKMLRAVFDLVRTTDLPITAEGIETLEQLDLVTDIGFDRGQGYLFARPVPLVDLVSTVRLRA